MTNHTLPWMDLVKDFGIPEEEARELFERVEPRKTLQERYLVIMEMIRSAKAEVAARA